MFTPLLCIFDQISVHSAQPNLISTCWYCDDVQCLGCLSGPSYSECSLQGHSSLYLWYKSAEEQLEEYSGGRKGGPLAKVSLLHPDDRTSELSSAVLVKTLENTHLRDGEWRSEPVETHYCLMYPHEYLTILLLWNQE